MDAGYVFDDLGEAVNEGDIVVMDNTAWLVTKISIPKMDRQIISPMRSNIPKGPTLVSVTLVSETTITAELGKKLIKVFRSSKKITTPPKANTAE